MRPSWRIWKKGGTISASLLRVFASAGCALSRWPDEGREHVAQIAEIFQRRVETESRSLDQRMQLGRRATHRTKISPLARTRSDTRSTGFLSLINEADSRESTAVSLFRGSAFSIVRIKRLRRILRVDAPNARLPVLGKLFRRNLHSVDRLILVLLAVRFNEEFGIAHFFHLPISFIQRSIQG